MIPLGVLASARVAASGGDLLPFVATFASASVDTWMVADAASGLEAVQSDDDDTSRVYASSVAQTLALDVSLAIDSGETVTTVTVHTRRRSTSGSTSGFKIGLTIGGVVYYGTALTTNLTTWQDGDTVWSLNPATGTAWTPTTVNAITAVTLTPTDVSPNPTVSFVQLTIA